MIIPFISVYNALDALKYYEKVLNAKISDNITMLKDVPGFDKPEYEGKVGHANMVVSGTTMFINDITSTDDLTQGSSVQFVLNLETSEELHSIFDELAIEGEIITPIQDVFWGATFGTVKDKFNVYWQLYFSETHGK